MSHSAARIGTRTSSVARSATTVAERGSLEINAISPTSSPGWICAKSCSPRPMSIQDPEPSRDKENIRCGIAVPEQRRAGRDPEPLRVRLKFGQCSLVEAARARHGEFGDFADPQQRQLELQVGGVAYRCPTAARPAGRLLRAAEPFLDADSPASPFASAAAYCGAFLAARSASLHAASCCLACSSSDKAL
jgi:hypothetical protein